MLNEGKGKSSSGQWTVSCKQCNTSHSQSSPQSPSPQGRLVARQAWFEFDTPDPIIESDCCPERKHWLNHSRKINMDVSNIFKEFKETEYSEYSTVKMRLVHCSVFRSQPRTPVYNNKEAKHLYFKSFLLHYVVRSSSVSSLLFITNRG